MGRRDALELRGRLQVHHHGRPRHVQRLRSSAPTSEPAGHRHRRLLLLARDLQRSEGAQHRRRDRVRARAERSLRLRRLRHQGQLRAASTLTLDRAATCVVAGIESGNRLPTVPEFQMAAAATFHWHDEQHWPATLTGVYQHVGSRFTQIGDQAAGFGTVNLNSFGTTRHRRPVHAEHLHLQSGAAGLRHRQPAHRLPPRQLGHRVLHQQRHRRDGAAGPRSGARHARPRRLPHQSAAHVRHQHAVDFLSPFRRDVAGASAPATFLSTCLPFREERSSEPLRPCRSRRAHWPRRLRHASPSSAPARSADGPLCTCAASARRSTLIDCLGSRQCALELRRRDRVIRAIYGPDRSTSRW